MNNNTYNELISKTIELSTHETPFFLFSKKKILENYHKFKELFPNSLIHYAMKANSETEVLQLLSNEGSGFEVASKYELDWLKAIHVPAENIIYGTSVKPVAHIKEFYEYGVRRYACDSFPELEKIAAIAPGSKIYIRTRVNDAGSVFKFSEKFGTEMANIIPLLLRAKELGLYPYGISFHVGSQASDPTAWAKALAELVPIMIELKNLNITLDVLDIGGGYPCLYASSPSAPTLEEIAQLTIEQYKKLPYQPQLLLEPGRGIIADTSVCVASIIARIERKGNSWLFLDVGVYNGLFETMAYQGSTRYPITALRLSGDAGDALFEIAGPTGDSPDVITREALLPQDIQVGEKLIIHNVGAYSLSVTSQFNGFPKPSVYYIDN